MRVAVLGCSPLSIGPVVAADLAGLGHEVRLAAFDAAEARRLGPVTESLVIGPSEVPLLCGRQGKVALAGVTDEPTEAMAGAELVLIDAPAAAIEARIDAIAAALESGQHIHFETHGYWPCLRAARRLRAHGAAPVTMSEGTAPTHAGAFEGDVVTAHVVRRNIALGVFPAARTEAVAHRIAGALPLFMPARDVLAVNLESMNFLVHPAITLLNVAGFDRAGERGATIDFYGEGSTRHAGVLAEALDAERCGPSSALGLPFRPLSEQIAALYGGRSDRNGSVQEAIAAAPFYQALPRLPVDRWADWMRADIPLAHVPFVHLAEALGTPVPLHRGLVEIMGALLERDFWRDGLTLRELGLSDMTAEAMTAFAGDGAPQHLAGDGSHPIGRAGSA